MERLRLDNSSTSNRRSCDGVLRSLKRFNEWTTVDQTHTNFYGKWSSVVLVESTTSEELHAHSGGQVSCETPRLQKINAMLSEGLSSFSAMNEVCHVTLLDIYNYNEELHDPGRFKPNLVIYVLPRFSSFEQHVDNEIEAKKVAS